MPDTERVNATLGAEVVGAQHGPRPFNGRDFARTGPGHPAWAISARIWSSLSPVAGMIPALILSELNSHPEDAQRSWFD